MFRPCSPPYLFFTNKRASDHIYMTIGGDFENRGLSGKGGCGSKILSTNTYQVVPHFQGINSFTLNPALLK